MEQSLQLRMLDVRNNAISEQGRYYTNVPVPSTQLLLTLATHLSTTSHQHILATHAVLYVNNNTHLTNPPYQQTQTLPPVNTHPLSVPGAKLLLNADPINTTSNTLEHSHPLTITLYLNQVPSYC